MAGKVFDQDRRKIKNELQSTDKIASTISKITFEQKSLNPAAGFVVSIMLGVSIWILLAFIVSYVK